MAPPKRKSGGGRVTPKKVSTPLSPAVHGARTPSTPKVREGDHPDTSARYTPPNPKEFYESPIWVPVLMLTLLGLGVVAIIIRYIAWDSNTPVLIGLVLMLAGLFVATKWH